jgi:hypothetical protein
MKRTNRENRGRQAEGFMTTSNEKPQRKLRRGRKDTATVSILQAPFATAINGNTSIYSCDASGEIVPTLGKPCANRKKREL